MEMIALFRHLREYTKLKHSYIAGGNINGTATLENSLVLLQISNIELSYNLTIPFLGIQPREIKAYIHINIYIYIIFIVVFIIIAPK